MRERAGAHPRVVEGRGAVAVEAPQGRHRSRGLYGRTASFVYPYDIRSSTPAPTSSSTLGTSTWGSRMTITTIWSGRPRSRCSTRTRSWSGTASRLTAAAMLGRDHRAVGVGAVDAKGRTSPRPELNMGSGPGRGLGLLVSEARASRASAASPPRWRRGTSSSSATRSCASPEKYEDYEGTIPYVPLFNTFIPASRPAGRAPRHGAVDPREDDPRHGRGADDPEGHGGRLLAD
jgi:hypothetical protein